MTRRTAFVSLFFLGALTIITFLPSFRSDFIDLDDDTYLTENPLVKNLSPVGIKNIFLKAHEDLHKPLVFLTFAVEYHFFGLNPHVYHTVNILLHLLNVFLVFWWIYLMARKPWIAFITATMFAVHPLRVESVSWVAERKDVLYALFYIGSLISYVLYIQTKQMKYRYVCLVSFILSMLSKPMGITLPAVLLLTDYFYGRKITAKVLLEKVPYVLIGIGWAVLTVLAVGWGREKNPITFEGFMQGPFNASYSLLFYLYKFFIPTDLFVAYTHPNESSTPHQILYYLSPAIAFVICWLVWKSAKFSRSIPFTAGFYVLTILPVLQLFPTNPTSIVNDHYTYVPLIPLAWILCEAVPAKAMQKLGILAILVLSFMTYHQALFWRNSFTLWDGMIRHFPNNAFAYNHRGNIYVKRGEYEKAMADFDSAVKNKPQLPEGYNNRGIVHSILGKQDEAMQDFKIALNMKPNFVPAYINRANALSEMGHHEEAIWNLTESLKIIPTSEAYNNRGNALMLLGKVDDAIGDFSKSLIYSNTYVNGYIHRGKAYMQKGLYDKALSDFTEALKLDPTAYRALYHRGNLYSLMEKHEEAIRDFSKAIEYAPKEAELFSSRGTEYVYTERLPEALADFNHAIELDPKHSDARNNRGCYYLGLNNYDEAMADFNEALRLNPSSVIALKNRGSLYQILGNKQKAAADFEAAKNAESQTAAAG